MSIQEDIWTTRLRAAVDDHPAALMYDVPSYVAAGRKRVRRNRVRASFATVAAVAVVAAVLAVTGVGTRGARAAARQAPTSRSSGRARTGGWRSTRMKATHFKAATSIWPGPARMPVGSKSPDRIRPTTHVRSGRRTERG